MEKVIRKGYIFIKLGSYWKAEHILVAERVLGRDLTETERIHHKNFDKTDNRPENLVLFDNQYQHAHWHRQFEQFGATRPLKRVIEEKSILNIAKSSTKLNLLPC